MRHEILALVLVATVGCTTRPATQVVVEVDAETGVRHDLDVVHVVVNGGDGSTIGAPSIQRLDIRQLPPRWPFTVVIAPLDRDPERRYEVVVTAEGAAPAGGGDRPVLARVRAISGFVPGETRLLRLVLEDACRGIECRLDQTCRDGDCVDARVETSALEDPHGGGGRTDAASPMDGPEPIDVGPTDDAGPIEIDADDMDAFFPVDAPECVFDARADRSDWRAPAQTCSSLMPDTMSISIDPVTCDASISAGMLCGSVPPVSWSSAHAYWHGTTSEPFSMSWCGRSFTCTGSLEPPYMRLHCGSCAFAFGTPP